MGSTRALGDTTFTVMFVPGTRMRFLAPESRLGFCALGIAVRDKCPSELRGAFMAFHRTGQTPAADYYQQYFPSFWTFRHLRDI